MSETPKKNEETKTHNKNNETEIPSQNNILKTPSQNKSLKTPSQNKTPATPNQNKTPKTPNSTPKCLFGSPAPGSQQSNNSPSTRGKAENLSGYLVGVGLSEQSKKKNHYFLLQVQVSKTELISVMVMENGQNPTRGEFLALTNSAVKFSNVYPGDGTYFYHTVKGSSFEATHLDYGIDDLTVSLSHISTKTSGVFHVKCMLRWKGEVETAKNGSNMRDAIIADTSGSWKLTVWKRAWWSLLEENVVYVMTGLKLEEYYGFYLRTTGASTYQKCEEDFEAAWPGNIDSLIPIKKEKNLDFPEIESVSLASSSICNVCSNPVVVTDGFFDCTQCKKMYKDNKCNHNERYD